MQVSKPILLHKLQAELAAAGITVAGLSMSGATLLQVLANGGQAEMPAGSQAVVDAHDATDPVAAEQTAATSDLQTNYQTAVARLTDIITNGGSYTAAQVRQATIDEAVILKRLLRLLKAEVG